MSSDTHPSTPERLPIGPNADASPPTDPTPPTPPTADDLPPLATPPLATPPLATPPVDPPMSASAASRAETPPLPASAASDTIGVSASSSAVGSSDLDSESGPTLQPRDFAAAHVELTGETVPVYRPRHSDSPPASSPPFAAAAAAAAAASAAGPVGPAGESRSPSSMSAKLTALSAKSQAAKDPAPRVYGEPPSPLHVVLWPVAAAALAILVVAGIGMDLAHTPIIPLIALAFVCIGCWEFRWARQIWYVALITSGLWLIVHTIPIWLPFFFGLVIAYILSPLVDWIEAVLLVRFYVPVMAARTAAVFALFFLGLVLFVALDAFFISNVLETGKNLEQQFSGQDFEGVVARNIENLLAQFGVDVSEGSRTSIEIAAALSNFTGQVSTYVNSNLDSLLGTAGRAFGYLAAVLLDIIIMLFVVFFLLLDFPAMTAKMQGYFSPERSKRLNKLSRELSKILRQYLQGHSAVCVFVGLIFYAVLALMGHPYAGLLALIMGVFTFIPLIGPLTAGVVALVVTLTVPDHVGFYLIAVLFGYAVCQGLNDLILYPMIAGRSVKLHPVAALLVLFLIGHSFGIVGMFFAVPLTAMVRALITWMNEEHIPGFEWLKMLRPYEVRHARTLMLQRAEMLKRTTGIFRAASDADSTDAPDASR